MAKRREGLFRRRMELGHTQESAAQAIGVTTSTYSGWERGVCGCLPGRRRYIARAFRVSLPEVNRWFSDEEAAPAGMIVPEWLGHFAALEQGAAEVWSYEQVTVPGLLQTAEYATAVERDDIVAPTEEEVGRRVGVRLARQEALARWPGPLRLAAVVHEAVLWNVTGDGEVMWEQLDHLVGMAGRANIDLRVVPFGQPTHVASFGPFTLVTARDAADPRMVIHFDRLEVHYRELPAVVAAHAETFRHLQDVALSPAESVELIRTVAKERYQP